MQTSHKYHAFLIAMLSGIFLLTGCGKKGTASSSSSSSSDSDAGSDSIEFHNKLIEFSKIAREPLRNIVDETKKSTGFITYTPGKPMWDLVRNYMDNVAGYPKLIKSNLAAPKSFSKDDQEFFNSRIKLTKDSAAELSTIVDTLLAYYKAEDYKDDKHKKFLDLEPRIGELVQQINKSTGEMGERSEEIASAAERETLKKNPIGIYILNMRDVMAKCEEQVDILTDERMIRVGSGTESKTDAQKAETVSKVKDLLDPAEKLSQEIADMAVKFKAVDMSALAKRPALAKAYENFFTTLDNEQGEMRKTLRRIKEWGYIGNESDLKNFSSTAKPVIDAHNSFIDAVNNGN